MSNGKISEAREENGVEDKAVPNGKLNGVKESNGSETKVEEQPLVVKEAN